MTENIHTHNFYAMGSHMAVWLEHPEAEVATAVMQEVETQFATAEKRMTRFSDDSELSQLNAQAGEWVELSSDLWQVVNRALWMAEETDGLFDPTLLVALEQAGYNQSFEHIHEVTMASTTHTNTNGRYRDIQFNIAQQAIKLPVGVKLDLGGIGKGYTAQQAINYLRQWGPCLIDAGGDLTAGEAPADYPGWPVGIAAPWSEGQDRENLLRLWLYESSLATSGIDYRRWQNSERNAHHIIDPRTGQPTDTDLLTVSVLSEDACTAETWATAALVAGLEEGGAMLHERYMGAAFINHDWQVSLTPLLAPQVEWEGISIHHS